MVLKGKAYVKLKMYVLERDNYRCVFCGNPSSLTPAHVQRRSQGRLDTPRNLITACVVGMDGKEGCHTRFDKYEIELPEETREMLRGEPETVPQSIRRF